MLGAAAMYSRYARFQIAIYVVGFLWVGSTIAGQNGLARLAFLIACGTMCDVRTLPERKQTAAPASSSKVISAEKHDIDRDNWSDEEKESFRKLMNKQRE
jgi:hypothetical protein